MWSPDPGAPGLSLLLVGALVVLLWTLGLGLLRLRSANPSRRTGQQSVGRVIDPTSVCPPDGRVDDPTCPSVPSPLCMTLGGRICAAFHAWLLDWGEHCPADDSGADFWAAFDQLVRETLSEHLGASRVRCYHVRAGCDTLQSMRGSGLRDQASGISPGWATPAGADPRPPMPDLRTGPSARRGVLGHVATTGREFVAGDRRHGPLVDHLAEGSEDEWAWVWPIREQKGTVGIVAVGQLQDPNLLTPDLRQTIGTLLTLCYLHRRCLERLQVVGRTDRASGVLTRNDFFTLAGQALADSYQANEPVVVVVLAVEGLRGLDDNRCWRQRDAIIEHVAAAIARRSRSEDLMGRWADDRFVMLLRRLDSGLGRLIAEKMLAAANECVAQLPVAEGHVRLRAGLAGSGLSQPSLETLLAAAFEAVERARQSDMPLQTDLDRGAGANDQGSGDVAHPPRAGNPPRANDSAAADSPIRGSGAGATA